MERVTYLLDTDTCIHIINRRPEKVFARFDGLRYGDVGISSITGAELHLGIAKTGSERNLQALRKFLAPLAVLPFDEPAMRQYGVLRADLERRGKPIGAFDILIAAHAISVEAILVTNNRREFDRVTGLRCENWV